MRGRRRTRHPRARPDRSGDGGTGHGVGTAARRSGAVRAPVAVVLTAAPLVALASTSGLAGPMLSRHTSAAAIALPGLMVALAAQLPSAPVPSMVAGFVWASLIP